MGKTGPIVAPRVTLLMALLAITSWAAAVPAPERARMADEFVDSIGVCVTLGDTGSPYSNMEKLVQPALKNLGTRHIRDRLSAKPSFIEAHNRLAASGQRLMLTAIPARFKDMASIVATLKRFNGLEAVEAVPQTDLGFSYKGREFPLSTLFFFDDLRQAMDSEPTLKGIPLVVGAPEHAASYDILCGVAKCPLAFVGIGALRLFPSGQPPSLGLDEDAATARKLSGDRPLFITEAGYHDQVSYRGEGQPGIPETVAGRYMSRLWFEAFRAGAARAYARELLDLRAGTGGPPTAHYGLVKPDGMIKLSGFATRNIVALLADPGPPFNPGVLEYELITRPDANVKHVLLQKRDARFYLVVWQDLPSYDPYRGEVQEHRMSPAMLFLNTPTTYARFYQPLMSPNAHRDVHGFHDRIPFNIPDHPMVIEIAPMRPRIGPDGRAFYPPVQRPERPRKPQTGR